MYNYLYLEAAISQHNHKKQFSHILYTSADLDIGKDFLTSWKSMSEDDQMDFDFPTVAKGNKKPFKFDNM